MDKHTTVIGIDLGDRHNPFCVVDGEAGEMQGRPALIAKHCNWPGVCRQDIALRATPSRQGLSYSLCVP